MKGLFKRTSAAVAAAVLSVSAFTTGVSAFGGVTNAVTPDDQHYTVIKWTYQASAPDDWMNAPGMPALVGDEIVYISGTTLNALDKETGTKLAKQGTLASAASYGLSAPIYADGKIIVALSGGIVQAFDANTFESLWVYHDALGGQAACTVAYDNGYVYTGFWNSETEDANFVCVPVEDKDTTKTDEEQAPAWTYASKGGFYWSGAEVNADLVIFGTDNGDDTGDGAGSKLVSVAKNKSIEDGRAEVVSEVSEGIAGDLRSGITYDGVSGYYYVTSKANKLIRFKTDGAGAVTDVQSLELPGASSSTPVIANGRLYIGICGESAWTEYSGHKIAVIDTASFSIAYTVETNGYCQSSALISDRNGENYVYFTANYTPGNVYVLHDKPGMTAPDNTQTAETPNGMIETCPVLYAPHGDLANYCLSSVLADDDGDLYLKNDSNNIIALEEKFEGLDFDGLKYIYKKGMEYDTSDVKVYGVYKDGTKVDVTADTKCDVPEFKERGEYKAAFHAYHGLYPNTNEPYSYEFLSSVYVFDDDEYDDLMKFLEEIETLRDKKIEESDRSTVEDCRKLLDSFDDMATSALSCESRDYYDVLTAAEKALPEKPPVVEKKVGKVYFKDGFTSTENAVRINWEAAENATGYRVYKYNPTKQTYVKLGEVKGTTAKIKNLTAGKEYKFKVKAFSKDADGNYTFGKASAAKIAVTKPSKVRITGSSVSKSAVRLIFTKSKGATGYRVYMYNSSSRSWEKVKTVTTTSNNIRIAGLKKNKTYKFKVQPFKRTSVGTVWGYKSDTYKAKTKKR